MSSSCLYPFFLAKSGSLLVKTNVATVPRAAIAAITMIIMKELNVAPTRFRLIHKEVRKILMDWANQRLCVHMGTTHYTHSSKTKMIMEFPDEMIDFFRFEGFVAFPI